MRMIRGGASIAATLALAYACAAPVKGDSYGGDDSARLANTSISVSRLANPTETRKRLGLLPAHQSVKGIETLKIAVLDYGFDGVDGKRPYLPSNAVVVERYDANFVCRFSLGDPEYHKPLAPGNRHGRAMAQIIWAMTGSSPRGPQFFLLNANGPTMLRRAVRYAIESKVDIILFSDVFEGGGNGDGRGPVNHIVADAINAGIIWINAAGNYGRCVYNGPVMLDDESWLHFRPGENGDSLRFRNLVDENTVTITLTWNDYRDEEDAGTNKDLDLYVEDWNGKQIGASEKVQIAGKREAGPEESRNPRERVVVNSLAGNADASYRIRIKAKKGKFSTNDRIRVLLTANREAYVNPANNQTEEAIRFLDATGKGEIYPPADHPLVLTVGDGSETCSNGPTLDHRIKPDVVIEDSRAYFTDGEMSAGASNAAAYFAGIVAVLKAEEPGLTPQHLFRLARRSTAYASNTEESPRSTGRRRIPIQTAPGVLRYSGDPVRPAVAINPANGGLTIQGRRFTFSGDLASRSFSVTPRTPPPVNSTMTTPTLTESQRARIWQTPSRERLREVVAHENTRR